MEESPDRMTRRILAWPLAVGGFLIFVGGFFLFMLLTQDVHSKFVAHPMMHEESVMIRSGIGPKGVLVLAHGGEPGWNRNVVNALKRIEGDRPVVVNFGMAISSREALEKSIRTLEDTGVKELRVVPLFVSSHSMIFRQFEFLLGFREKSPFDTGLVPIETSLQISMSSALDADPLVGEILLDRVGEISQAPSKETLILVSHGPVEDADNKYWIEMMEKLRSQIYNSFDFKEIHLISLRDDADPEVRLHSTHLLRSLVVEASSSGEALVLPVLISSGGIEKGIISRLEGLEYTFLEKGLVPHPNIDLWVSRKMQGVLE
jgi:sirohydrochlorin cobaltochelatase